MSELTFTWDSRDLSIWRGAKIDQALTRALTKAGNDAARAMKAAGTRSVRQRKRLKVKFVNEGLPLTFPKTKVIAGLAWRMDVSGAPIPLVDYPHRQVKRGVSVAVNNGKRKLFKSAFVATMRSGHVGIFRRAFPGAPRLPIQEAFSSRISDVFGDSGMIPAVMARAQTVFGSALDRLLPIELSKLR